MTRLENLLQARKDLKDARKHACDVKQGTDYCDAWREAATGLERRIRVLEESGHGMPR